MRRQALLTEAAKGPDELPSGVFITVERFSKKVRLTYTDRARTPLIGDEVSGRMSISAAEPEDGACRGAWVVIHVRTAKGYGPLLYDLAIELASRYGAGLTPDRRSVSDQARPIWRYYRAKRADKIKTSQLDSPDNQLTPDPADNCVQQAASEDPEGWQGSPLSKLYRSRGSPVTTKLERLGKLLWK